MPCPPVCTCPCAPCPPVCVCPCAPCFKPSCMHMCMPLHTMWQRHMPWVSGQATHLSALRHMAGPPTCACTKNHRAASHGAHAQTPCCPHLQPCLPCLPDPSASSPLPPRCPPCHTPPGTLTPSPCSCGSCCWRWMMHGAQCAGPAAPHPSPHPGSACVVVLDPLHRDLEHPCGRRPAQHRQHRSLSSPAAAHRC